MSDPTAGCSKCRDGSRFDVPIRMAFQPIVDLGSRSVFAYEALVRGPAGEPAADVMGRLGAEELYRFDQACRVTAIGTAARLGLRERLSINFLPQAVYEPEACIRSTLEAADKAGFATRQLIFEFSENEPIRDPAHVLEIVRYYRGRGMLTAFDDFGAGYAGLGLLADFQPDLVKIDMHLVRGIESSHPRQRIVGNLIRLCAELSVQVVAEGVETLDELRALRQLGISLAQGYVVAMPLLEQLPAIDPRVWADSG